MKSIMIVEDEAIVRMDLVEMLTESNYKVVAEAANGEKAIQLTDKYQPDLIIMDIKMPKMDGLKASKIIGKKYNIPILILTAYSHCEYVEKAKGLLMSQLNLTEEAAYQKLRRKSMDNQIGIEKQASNIIKQLG